MTRGWSAREIIEDEVARWRAPTSADPSISEATVRERINRLIERLKQAGHLKSET